MFWLESPAELFGDINVIPSLSQSYTARLNTLTRMVILIAIVLYILKVKWALQFLIFGILLIIILYYTQMNPPGTSTMDRSNFSIPLFSPMFPQSQPDSKCKSDARKNPPGTSNVGPLFTGVSTVSPSIDGMWYSVKNGPHILRKPPVIPPSPADNTAWGGYSPLLNVVRPTVVSGDYERTLFDAQFPSNYSNKINYSVPAVPSGGSGSCPSKRRPRVQSITRRQLMNQQLPQSPCDTGDCEEAHRQFWSEPHMLPQLPPYRNVGIAEPINNVNNISFLPSTGNYVYPNDGLNVYDPKYVRDYESHMHQLNQPSRSYSSDDLNPFRATPTLGISEHDYLPDTLDDNDDNIYKNYADINKGNIQYYSTNSNPFDGPLYVNTDMGNHASMSVNEAGQLISENFMDDVMNQQTADEVLYRESMMAGIQDKMNERSCQMRAAPLGFRASGCRNKC